MATITAGVRDALITIYIGMFQSAPGKAALSDMVAKYESGMTQKQIAAELATSAAFKAEYPDQQLPEEFADELVEYLASEATANGKTWATDWIVSQLEAGKSKSDIIVEAVNALRAATNTADFGDAKDALNNKLAVARYWAVTKEYDASNGSIIADVDSDADSAADAIADIDAIDTTFTLTKGVDNITGTDGDDVFVAPLEISIDGLVGAQTLQGQDTLNGGDGNDQLVAEVNATGTTWDPIISGIEEYYLTATSGTLVGNAGAAILDLSRATGYTQLWNINSRNDLDLEFVGEQAALGMRGVRGGTEYHVEYDADVAIENQLVIAQNVGSASTGDALLHILTDDPIDGMTLNASNSRLDVEAAVVGSFILNADGSNDLWLTGGADGATDLTITGSGELDLGGSNRFNNLVTLDSTEFSDDLSLDVAGSTILESVNTADGDDYIEVNDLAVRDSLSVDLAGGNDILAVWGATGTADINNLDFTGGMENVENLAFTSSASLSGTTTLDLDGFDDALTTVWFLEGEDLDGNGNTFAFANAPETLTFNVTGSIYDVNLDTGNVVDLTINGSGTNGVVDLDSLKGAALKNLSVNQTGVNGNVWLDAVSDANHNLKALESLSVSATNDAVVELTDANEGFDKLADVSVSGDDDATLNLTGAAGTVFVAGVQQQQEFSINVTGAGGLNSTSAGNVAFTSQSLPGGVVTGLAYSTNVLLLGNNSGFHDSGAASDIAAAFNSVPGTGITATSSGNEVIFTWDDFGTFDLLVFQNALSNATNGTLDSVVNNGIITTGVEQVEMVPGKGFEALETITVDAGDDAEANLVDVYGNFDLVVTGGDDAEANLFNTGAVNVTVAGGLGVTYDNNTTPTDMVWGTTGEAYVDVDGDTVGNSDLETVTVSGAYAEVYLASDLTSFETLDLSGVTAYAWVDVSGAIYGDQAVGQYVTYNIGATSNAIADWADVDFYANSVRESFVFVGDDIGDVVIRDFSVGADPVTGDRLDLSEYGYTNGGQLVFQRGNYDELTNTFTVSGAGADIQISDLNGGPADFSGAITIIGAGAQIDDLSAYNIIYA